MEYPGEEEGYQRLRRFPSSHHSSPITYYPQQLAYNVLVHNEKSYLTVPIVHKYVGLVSYAKTTIGQDMRITVDPTKLITYLFKLSLQAFHPGLGISEESSTLQIAYMCSIDYMMQEAKALEAHHPALKTVFSDPLSLLGYKGTFLRELSVISTLRKCMVEIRNSIQTKNAYKDRELLYIKKLGVDWWYDEEAIGVRVEDHKSLLILINYDQYIMLLDTLTSRFIVKITCTLSSKVGRDCLPSWGVISAIYKWGDQLIAKYGMAAYAVIGEFESFVTAALICFSDNDRLDLSIDYVNGINDNLMEIEQEYKIPVHVSQVIMTILREVNSINQLSEIFGLRKHWGNPPVEAKESGKAVQDKLTEDFEIDPYSNLKLLASFNRMIVIEFIKKHGEWPKCTFPSHLDNMPISIAHRNYNTRLPETSSGHDHIHWAYLEFQKNCEVPEFEDDLSMLNDKSVSLPQQHLDFVYDKFLRKSTRREPKEQRRLILEYLRDEKKSIKEIFHTVMNGLVPNEWLANSAAMKGTEMKYKKARIFAVLVYELRQYFAATEEIIKTCIFPYNPYQTMTMDETALLSRLRTVTTQMDPAGDCRHLAVLHIIDFSKWNLRMKYSNTYNIFKSIDNFIGMKPLIEASHDLFFRMVNLVQDRFNPPENGVLNTESDTIWRFHTRGWEGQRQKGWTVLTSALLSDLERMTGVDSIICGQGDNQTLLSKFAVPSQYRNPNEWIRYDKAEVRRRIDTYYSLLAEECRKVGLKIKTSESCRSLCYFNYGKRLYFSGVELSMTLKRLAKMATEPNDSFPTSESLLKAVMASEYAANLYSHTSLIPILVGQMLIVITLCDQFLVNPLIGTQVRKILQDLSLSLDSKLFRILMAIPSSVGGIALPTISSSLTRGHPDPLAADFALITLMARNKEPIAVKLYEIIQAGKWFSKEAKTADMAQLIRSPYSLNIRIPQSAKLPITNEVLPALKAYCRNKKVRELFSTSLTADEHSILRFLATSTPLHPIVLNDLYNRSIPGRRQMFLAGLSNTTSLSRLILDSSDDSILSRVSRCEVDQLKWWCGIVKDVISTIPPDSMVIQPHHVLLQAARDSSWHAIVVGVTVPHPVEQFKLIQCPGDKCGYQCATCCPERIEIAYLKRAEITLLGSDSTAVQLQRVRAREPYTGNSISEGIVQKDLTCLSDSAAFFDSVRVNLIRKWITTEDTAMDQFLKSLIATRTDTPLQILNRASGVPSRLSHNHRAALMATRKTCSSSSTTNISTRIYLSSNKMGKFSHGDVNYALPFGPSFLVMQELIAFRKIYKDTQDSQGEREHYHFHIWNDDVPIVYDGDIRTDSKAPQLSIPQSSLPLFASYSDLRFQDSAHLHDMLDTGGHSTVSLRIAKYAYATQLFGNGMMDEIVFRESLALHLRSQYARREQLISIGDIKLIGLRNVFQALALHFMLVLPSSVFTMPPDASASPFIATFLDTFSDIFWNHLCSPLSNPRLVKEVLKLSPSSTHSLATKHQRHLISTVKGILLSYVVDLIGKSRHAMITGICTPWLLFAPTKSALKHLYAKWVEGHILMLSSGCEAQMRREIIQYARDFSHNIHSTQSSQFLLLTLIIQHDFDDLCQKLFGYRKFKLPEPNIIKLSEAWVERLRSNPSQILLQSSQLENDISDYHFFSDRIQYVSVQWLLYSTPGGQFMTRTRSEPCKCDYKVFAPALRQECFFMSTGILSKTHYNFLDIIMSFELPVTGVACLGSKTGTEAAALSRLEENKTIYVNCFSSLTDFAAHAAATYIPPAFLLEGDVTKLVNSGESAMCCNDLLLTEGVEMVCAHLKGSVWSGVTCDIGIQSGLTIDERSVLITHSCQIAMMNLIEGGWIQINIRPLCCHEATTIITILSYFFHSVQMVPPSFITKDTGTLIFLGVNPVRATRIPEHREKIASVESNDKFLQVISFVYNLRWPLLCYMNERQRRQRLQLNRYGVSSTQAAIEKYLRGWEVDCSFDHSNREQLIESLDLYKQEIHEMTHHVVYSANKVFLGGNMPRESVLTIRTSHLTDQLQNLFFKIHRANLLRLLLSYPDFSFPRTEEIIHGYMLVSPTFSVDSITVTVEVNITQFFAQFSRYLYELLGTFFKFKYLAIESTTRISNIHLYGLQVDLNSKRTQPPAIGLCTQPPCIWSRWKWLKRSEILTVLQCARVSNTQRISVDLPHPYLLEELESSDMRELEVFPLDEKDPFKIYWHRLSTECDISKIITPCWVVCDIRDYPLFDQTFEIQSRYRCPWSGVSPSYLSLYLTCKYHQKKDKQAVYPDLAKCLMYLYPAGEELVNCKCLDCFSEIVLCRRYNLSPAWLDSVCSGQKRESVVEQSHAD